MWMAAEVVVVAWILGGGWLVLRGGPCDGLARFGGFVITYLVAALAAWLCDAGLSGLRVNMWLRVGAAIAVGLIASGAVWAWWFRSARAPAPRVRMWLETRAPRSVHRFALVLLALVWLAVHAAAWTVAINVVAASSPDQAAAIRRQTLISAVLLSDRLGARPADRASTLGVMHGEASDSAAQLRALGRLRAGFTSGIDGVLDASGAGRVMDAMDALHALMRLDDEQRGDLAHTIPELQRLSDDPLVLAIVDDDRLMALVREAGGGSLSAIYALGDEPRVQELVEDPRMRDAIAAIDLLAIRDRLRARERSVLEPMRWQLATIASSLEFDHRLRDPAGWIAAESAVLVWPSGRRFAVARASVAASTATRELRLRGQAAPSCWIDGVAVPPGRDGQARTVALPARGGELVLLFDTGVDAGVDSRAPCTCGVEVVASTPER